MHGILHVTKEKPKDLASKKRTSKGFHKRTRRTRGGSFLAQTVTPCVACIGVAPTGEVFAGVDQIGSLGKGLEKGESSAYRRG